MAEKKSVGHAYDIDFLNVIFAASSLFLFFSVVWMVWDDFDREWKSYQRQFVQLETEVTQLRLRAAQADLDPQRLEALRVERAKAEQGLASNQQQIEELETALEAVEADLFLTNQEWQFAKAEYDVDRYEFEELQEVNSEQAAERRPAIEAMFKHWLDLGLDVEALTAERDDLRGQLRTFTGRMSDIDTELRDLMAEATRLEDRLAVLEVDLVNDYLLNAPLLDFMVPSITVRQVITPNLVDDVNFTRVRKMDRCMTCHLAVDLVGYEDYPQPFRTHPNFEVSVGSASPHPLGTTGCTVCHEGMGQSITFRDASHTPTGEEQRVAWEETYGWEDPPSVGLPDAAYDYDRGVMREVPSGDGVCAGGAGS